MTMTRLTNAGWGFPTMCFVCDEANPGGMRVAFFHDDEADAITAELTLSEAFSGAPALVHGGVIMALCDEAQSWATIAIARTFALTATNSHRFLRPVRLGRPYRVTARITGRDESGIRTAARVESVTTGKVSVEADALFVPLDPATAARAIGVELTGRDATFLA